MRTVARLIIGLGAYTEEAGAVIQVVGERVHVAGSQLIQLGMALYEGDRVHPMFSPNGDLDQRIFPEDGPQVTRDSLP